MIKFVKRTILNTINRTKLIYLSLGQGTVCPVCQWQGRDYDRVLGHGKPAPNPKCPSCGSSPRHRLAYLLLSELLPVHADKTLHFAPEKCISPWLRRISREYLSVDLSSPRAMRHMDITSLDLPDNSYSLIWCSHVLEHIDADNKAMAELFRVLEHGGLAVIMVPVYGAQTYEDPAIQSPSERLKHFKQSDHVRLYGLDIQQRLSSIGFVVELKSISDLSDDVVCKYALDYPSTKEIFLCRKGTE
jgi:SAM-dependent methyltransferase